MKIFLIKKNVDIIILRIQGQHIIIDMVNRKQESVSQCIATYL